MWKVPVPPLESQLCGVACAAGGGRTCYDRVLLIVCCCDLAVTSTSTYNDLFGFFVTPAGSNTSVNVAKLPSSTNPVGINTVNQAQNTYYISNIRRPLQSAHATELDGLTKLLTTDAYDVVAGTTYRLKLAISERPCEAAAQCSRTHVLPSHWWAWHSCLQAINACWTASLLLPPNMQFEHPAVHCVVETLRLLCNAVISSKAGLVGADTDVRTLVVLQAMVSTQNLTQWCGYEQAQ